jgi:hypothetical protein
MGRGERLVEHRRHRSCLRRSERVEGTWRRVNRSRRAEDSSRSLVSTSIQALSTKHLKLNNHGRGRVGVEVVAEVAEAD